MPAFYDKTRKYQLIREAEFNKHFQAEDWRDYNRMFFDGLAPKYDRLNEVLSLGQHQRIKRRAIDRMQIQPGWRILDLCTGSGDMALFMARRFQDCEIIGFDASEKMLEIAKKRTAGLPHVHFQCGDALALPFEDGSFDAVLISFGLRNLDDLKAGILEMKRVLRPGGILTSLDLGQPPRGLLRWIHRVYFGKLIPFLGKVWFHRNEFNSFQYLPASGKYFPEQGELVEIFGELGLTEVRRWDYMLGSISQQLGRLPGDKTDGLS